MWYFKEEDIRIISDKELCEFYTRSWAYYIPWGSRHGEPLFSPDDTINNTKNKPMNFIQQAQLKKFTESSKVAQLAKAIETAQRNSALFAQVSARLADTAIRLQDDVALLNHYADHNEITSLEALMEVVEDKIEAIETSALSEITTELGELFGITKQAKLSSKAEKKKEAMKSLGLV